MLTTAAYKTETARLRETASTTQGTIDTVDAVLADVKSTLEIPGDVAADLAGIQSSITIPATIVTILSPMPFGLGSTVMSVDTITRDVRKAIEGPRSQFAQADARLDPALDRIDGVRSKIATVQTPGAEVATIDATIDDTAGHHVASLETGAFTGGSDLEGRVEVAFAAVADALAQKIEDLLGDLPLDAIDAATSAVNSVLKPVTDAPAGLEDDSAASAFSASISATC